MSIRAVLYLSLAILSSPLAATETGLRETHPLHMHAFEQLLSFEGDWIDVDGTLGMKDEVAVTYRVTSNRSAVIESIFVGKPYEMVTVFHRDQDQIALTHYCSLGNQPQMLSIEPNQLEFSLSGGSGFDPEHDRYMHSRRMRALSEHELEGEWQEHIQGAATDELHKQYRLRRVR
ncbi:hypothetical protein [Marinimicrobium sp. ABcell2]|uniref:hypothetical protein n=1 Tax=Marinimicrobium sp. ABcell2 TaxID=3069751 RepID=UPI0027B20C3F|nr:hypothetical protein [Marinimicrobium sp. ABcell2]MDQ2075830.1 hypothetical protein [Marinimicrobium sp. ABcell2]